MNEYRVTDDYQIGCITDTFLIENFEHFMEKELQKEFSYLKIIKFDETYGRIRFSYPLDYRNNYKNVKNEIFDAMIEIKNDFITNNINSMK